MIIIKQDTGIGMIIGAKEGPALMHYRTPGSKNGVRRFQDKYGRLTPEGYRHYGIDPNGRDAGDNKPQGPVAKNISAPNKEKSDIRSRSTAGNAVLTTKQRAEQSERKNSSKVVAVSKDDSKVQSQKQPEKRKPSSRVVSATTKDGRTVNFDKNGKSIKEAVSNNKQKDEGGKAENKEDTTGRYGKGNIDLNNRQVVKNKDGSISTERSFSVNIDGKETLLPTVINGKIVSEDAAIEHYYKTGQHLGRFDTVKEAEEYAEQLHNRQDWYYNQKEKNK